MKIIDLSVIIPTLNEQHYIGDLLDSLARQTVQPKEVIIVDAYSEDTTKEEVAKRKSLFPSLSFYQIPKETIAKQRNFGANKSQAAHLLFLDADMQLVQQNTLETLWHHIEKTHPDLAACYIMPLSPHTRDKVLYGIGNAMVSVLKHVKPVATTMSLYVRREVFIALLGFTETIHVGEDFEFVQRATKAKYTFCVFRKPVFYTSIRRFKKEGRIRYITNLLKAGIHIKLKGYHKNPVPYEFGKFTEKV